MSLTDPIADMLTRIRNAVMVRHDAVLVPASTMKLAIARLLKEEGFIHTVEVEKMRDNYLRIGWLLHKIYLLII